MLNRLHFMWIFYSVVITIMGLNVVYFKKFLPIFIIKAFQFGKLNKDGISSPIIFRMLEVPKRWFSHFYIFAVLYFMYITLAIWKRYAFQHSSDMLNILLDILYGDVRKSTVSPESVAVVSVLLLFQACRRCYECLFISVYSEAKMNVLHYIVGLTFYFGVGLSVLCEAPGFENNGSYVIKFSSGWISWKHIVGIIIFLFGFHIQFQSHITLANLRKDVKGEKVVTTAHFIPSGGWFDYISCPHYLGEIIMYCSVNIIFGGKNFTWWLVCLWVIINQTVTALMSHQWYQYNFKNYPARKALIPCIF